MITISKGGGLVTVINVFTVDPDKQQQLADLLISATETFVRNAPGFISAILHRSLDRTKVAMYAQWRSVEDYQAMREDGASAEYFREALTLGKFEGGLYEVVESYSASSS